MMNVLVPYEKPNFEESLRWVRVKNVASSDAPSYALLRITGSDDGDGTYLVNQPNEDSQDGLLVASRFGILAGQYGMATYQSPTTIAYARTDQTDPQPAVGKIWGSKANSWYAWENRRGFFIIGNRIDGAPPNGIVDALRVSAMGVDDAWLARLTSFSIGMGKYSWQERIYDSSGNETNGPRGGTHNARPVMFDTWNSTNPGLPVGTNATGTLVLMWELQQALDRYYFLPLVYASDVRGGYLSINDQTIKGIKRFLDRTHSDTGFTAGSYATPGAKYYPTYAKILGSGSSESEFNISGLIGFNSHGNYKIGLQGYGTFPIIEFKRKDVNHPSNDNVFEAVAKDSDVQMTLSRYKGGTITVAATTGKISGSVESGDNFLITPSLTKHYFTTWESGPQIHATNTVEMRSENTSLPYGGVVQSYVTELNDSNTPGNNIATAITHIGSRGWHAIGQGTRYDPSAVFYASYSKGTSTDANFVAVYNYGQIRVRNRIKFGSSTVRNFSTLVGINHPPEHDLGPEGDDTYLFAVTDGAVNNYICTLNSKGKFEAKSIATSGNITVGGNYSGTIDGGTF